ncbi:hypothetical protein FSP39_002238 [Pinctada imbricata]|uniref:DNA-directed DNA polymerase n=1 Tax=Pinctada imbricata TaxID=66713 RepID=A0AA88YGJ7_PINIB|nr:hypothetical protein FSP39_002238 [Pinctada imbricata]
MQRGAGFLQPTPYMQGQEPWIDNEPLREIYDTNSPLILQRHQEGSVFSIYNIPLTNDFSIHEMMESMEEIYDRQEHAFRLNLNFGLILVNTETGENRYFRPFSNRSLFQRPMYVSRRHDLSKLRQRLERFNIVDYILQQRPDTKWKPVLVTNVHFHLFHLNYLLGAPLQLPEYIKANSSIVVLDKRRKDGIWSLSIFVIATDTLKFLDITSYLSPGINYAKFLKAFDVVEDKGFFPYDWLDHIEKLEYPQLPPHAAFYSALKDHNISSDEYRFCQKVWKDNGMCTFKDFLVWYNNLDVGPFVTAVQNLQKYYFERHIDIFKVSISVPGLARQMLFKCGRQAGASFALCNDNNKDLYYTIKDNIIGGPSIIFNRYHQVGKTNIRNDPSKPCKKIVGFDANALYLFCIGQPMPTGPFVRRCLEEQFKPNKTEKYMLAYHWLNWLNHSSGLNIVHKLNQSQEKRVGKYPVDGFDED